MRKSLVGSALLAACLMVAAVPSANADQIAFNLTGGDQSGNGQNSFLGFQFTIDQDVQVTSLGLIDVLGNAMTEDHYVGIFDTDGTTLLASTIVTAGEQASPLTSILNSISPVILSAGTYDIGAYYSGGDDSDQMIDFGADYTTGPGVTWDEALDNINSPGDDNFDQIFFASPDQQAFFGPDFAYTDVPAPEPASLAMMGSGLAAAAFLRRRRKA